MILRSYTPDNMRKLYKLQGHSFEMNKTTLLVASVLLVALTVFLFISNAPVEKATVSPEKAFSFVPRSVFLTFDDTVVADGEDACSGYTPGTTCTSTNIGTRSCAARGGGACACTCLNSGSGNTPAWVCGVCSSGKCDSFGMKCEKKGDANAVVAVP